MKINFETVRRLPRALKGAAAVAGLLLSGAAAVAQPFASPVGTTWDVLLSGNRSGVGFIDFADDGSFTITEFVVPNVPSASSGSVVDEGRGFGGDDSRNGFVFASSSSSSVGVPTIVIFGEGTAAGRWGFNSQGNLIGFFSEVSGEICTTNEVVVTNSVDGTITTNENRHCTFNTNEVSFSGKVVAGRHITLSCTTGGRRTLYRGLPQITLTNIAGSWYCNRIETRR